MRVLVWTGFYAPDVGGIETLTRQLHPVLADRSHEVVVLTGFGPAGQAAHDIVDGIPVHRLALRETLAAGSPAAVARARRQVEALRRDLAPDLVHFHVSGPEAFFELATRPAAPGPVLLTLHNQGDALGLGGEHTLYDRALAAADWVTGVSTETVAEARRAVPAIAGRSSVVPNPIDLPSGAPYPPPTGPAVLAMIGRLVPQKGVDLAVRALAGLRAEGRAVTLELAGDGTERAAIEALAGELGVADGVVLRGTLDRPTMDELLARATAVVMPSRFEGLPMAALEVMAAGRPLVATPVGGLAGLVDDGVTGLVVPPEDVDGLRAALVRLLDEPELAARLGRAAHERAGTWGSVVDCADRYEALYRRLVGEGAGA